MANCLYECLREAGLEQYYPNFEASGITRSEGLTALTMQEYSDYGIDDMDDRKRLFQLIQIIKNVQKNGKRCGQSCDNEYDDRTPRSTNHYDDECNDTTPRFTNRTDNDCESRMPRLTNRRSSIESDSSDDDLQQVYNSCAKQYAPIILNNGVLDKKFIRNNNNNIMRATSFDKLDKKPDVFFVKTSPKKSKSKSYSSALYQSLSDSETLEANVGNSYHGPKLKERSIERIKYSGMQYDYGVPSTNRKFTPTSNSTSTPTRPSTDSALTEDRIKVCIRKRPLNKKEKRNKEADVITVENPNKVVLDENKTAVDLTKFTQMHEFYFDEVFDENQTNEQIYEKTAKPLVNCIFRGGKATCFAYGQTGAGKTHTMLGNGKVQGLYLLAAKDIFSVLQSGYHGRSLSVWISYFEIYCGQLFDLLNARKRLHAREDGKNNVCIAGIKEFQIGNVAALMEVIEYGNQVRSTGVSGVNSDSSRSHAILQIQLKDRAKRKLGSESLNPQKQVFPDRCCLMTYEVKLKVQSSRLTV
ncbi:kinesin-like protein KIF24 [Glandiceps talaboti]